MKVAVVMGSKSDLPVMQEAVDILRSFGIETVVDIVSAHRTPEKLMDFGTNAHRRGFNVIVAGAGGAAHLPGMLAAMSPLPVIGVPVATVALNGAKNAGILAAQILASQQPAILDKIINYKESLKQAVLTAAATLNDE